MKDMKVAFVGKGGSGKSTLTALFIRSLAEGKAPLLAIDADLNIHLAGLLGIAYEPQKALSGEKPSEVIRSYLRGDNQRIKTLTEFVKTTPPSRGSKFLEIQENDILIKNFAIPFGERAYYAHVGTYEAKDIGTMCYHGNLAVFENILSHSRIGKKEWLIADMVAGVDAFANSLHAQFDAIVLVVEPTPEGLGVYDQYHSLALSAGIWDRVIVLGNKVEDREDVEYLKKHIGDKLTGTFSKNLQIKRDRQSGKPIALAVLSKEELAILGAVARLAQANYVEPNLHLAKLEELHMKFSKQDWVIASYGDLSRQVDPGFRV